MGKSTLVKLPASPTRTKAVPEQLNNVINAFLGLFVMRNAATGIEEDGVSDIGEPGGGRPRDINFTRNLVKNGQVLDTSSLTLRPNGVISGASKASGFPDYLSAGGGALRTFNVLGSTKNLVISIQGSEATLAADITSPSLPLAPSSNNTCVINDANFSAQFWTKIFGEYGGRAADGLEHGELAIASVGSEISSIVGTVQAFKVGAEVFLAFVKSPTALLIIRRGICGTSRIALSNGDSITLLRASWCFLRSDLITITPTSSFPSFGPAAPASPSDGDFWFDTENQWWATFVTGSWSALHDLFIGLAVCDSAGCKWVEAEDFNIGYSSDIEAKICVYSNTALVIKDGIACSIAGEDVLLPGMRLVDIGAAIMPGETEAASTWYFLYLDKLGNFYMSEVAPRLPGRKLGWYHPSEHYRCVGIVYNDSSLNFRKYSNVLHLADVRLSQESFTGFPEFGEGLPVGAIIDWDKSLSGVPQILPENFMECNGATITDARSPMVGQAVRNINGLGQFVRGASTSGTAQSNQNKSSDTIFGILHLGSVGAHDFVIDGAPSAPVSPIYISTQPMSVIPAGTPNESRPDNITMVKIMKIF